MKIFITGGAGQVGSHVADILLTRGDQVMAIDNLATGHRDNLEEHTGLAFIEGSVADSVLIDRLFGEFKPDVVVHTAASYKDPEDWATDALVNAVGSANIAKACKTHKVARLIYFQTALCYGTKPVQSPIRLDHPIIPVNSSYAISKTAGEHYVQFSGVDWVTFRLANVIGPRNVSGPLPIFYRRLIARTKMLRYKSAPRLLLRRRPRDHRGTGRRRHRTRHLSFLNWQRCFDQGALRRRRARDEAQPQSGARNPAAWLR